MAGSCTDVINPRVIYAGVLLPSNWKNHYHHLSRNQVIFLKFPVDGTPLVKTISMFPAGLTVLHNKY